MFAFSDRAPRVRDAGRCVAGRLHHHLDVRRLQHRRRVVGEARRGDPLVAPADAPARLARPVRRQVGDRRDLDAGRGRHLRRGTSSRTFRHRSARRGPGVLRSTRLASSRCRFIRDVPFPACGFVAHCYANPGRYAMAQPPEVEWRKLRADQLREQARVDAVVILPVASLEQHGPHLPVEADSMLARRLRSVPPARSQRSASAVVLPVVWTGLSEHHMSFGGTITLDFPAFFALMEDVCRSVLRHGFKRIVLMNAHGGNENALRTITDELTPKLGVPIVQFTYCMLPLWSSRKILETQGALMHACEAETSMMLAVRPDLVADGSRRHGKGEQHTGCCRCCRRWRVSLAHHCRAVLVRGDRQPGASDRGEGSSDCSKRFPPRLPTSCATLNSGTCPGRRSARSDKL